MNPANPSDPFGLVSKTQASLNSRASQSEEPVAGAATQPSEVKQKRAYLRRAAAGDGASISGAKPEAGVGDELVLGFFSTGVLVIQQGKQVLHLSIEQRSKLADFLELVAP